MINIDPPIESAVEEAAPPPIRAGLPGAYAQSRMERERSALKLKRRAMLPLAIGTTLVVMDAAFLATFQLGVPIAALVGVIVGAVFMYLLLKLPTQALIWTKGVEGERKAAKFIEPLLDAGFVALFNRPIPGGQGDIDAIVIGPTGVFTVETKNWSGKVDVRNDRLFVGDYDRTWVVGQIYREALAVQLTLGDELTSRRVTVTPLLCAIGGATVSGGMAGGVRVVDGKHLARTIADRPPVFDDEQVQSLARLADQRLRLPYEWEPKPS